MKHEVLVYPGTFDPMTYGHLDLIKRAIRISDAVVVAIADNQRKHPLLTLDERVGVAQTLLADYPQVTVQGFSNLLVDFVASVNGSLILRGLRAVSDFEYEFQLASMNRRLSPNVETVFLTPSEDYTFVSSSIVKEVARMGGDVSEFVPPLVIDKLHEKFT